MTSSLPFQLLPLPPRLGRGEKKEGREEGPGPRGATGGGGASWPVLDAEGNRAAVGGLGSWDFGER